MTPNSIALWTASLIFSSPAVVASAEPSLPDIYNGYRAARKNGALSTPDRDPHPVSELQRPGAMGQAGFDWKAVFLKFFPQEGRRVEKFNSVNAVTWASGNFDFDSAPEVLVSLSVMQVVGSYSEVEFPIAPIYQIIFVADKESRTIRNESIVPLVLNVTRDTDIDCGNCNGPQTIFSFVAAQDYNNDATLEVVLRKSTKWRDATASLSEIQLYANASQGWVPIQLDAPVLSEYEPSE